MLRWGQYLFNISSWSNLPLLCYRAVCVTDTILCFLNQLAAHRSTGEYSTFFPLRKQDSTASLVCFCPASASCHWTQLDVVRLLCVLFNCNDWAHAKTDEPSSWKSGSVKPGFRMSESDNPSIDRNRIHVPGWEQTVLYIHRAVCWKYQHKRLPQQTCRKRSFQHMHIYKKTLFRPMLSVTFCLCRVFWITNRNEMLKCITDGCLLLGARHLPAVILVGCDRQHSAVAQSWKVMRDTFSRQDY